MDRVAERPAARLSAAEARKFGLTLGAAFIVLAAFMAWRSHERLSLVFGAISAALVLAVLVAPTRLAPVERGWMRMALAISSVTTPIVLGILYLLVVTPFGIVRRTLGRNPLRHEAAAGTHWLPRALPRSDLERQF